MTSKRCPKCNSWLLSYSPCKKCTESVSSKPPPSQCISESVSSSKPPPSPKYCTDILEHRKYQAIDHGNGLIRIKRDFHSKETMIFNGELYGYYSKILRKEIMKCNTSNETEEHVVYTVFSPTDYRRQEFFVQSRKQKMQSFYAFVSEMINEEYNVIDCFIYGDFYHDVNLIYNKNNEKLLHFNSLGNNRYQFFFPKK